METVLSVAPGENQHSRTELKNSFHKNFVRGMIISIIIHAAIIGSYYAVEYLGSDDDIPTVGVRILKYSDLGPPPSISAIPPPPSLAMSSTVKPSIGVPVPVPDAEATNDQTIATQSELSSTPSPALEQGTGDGQVQVQQDIVITEDDPGMDAFVAVEKQPQIVKRVIPVYPDMAMRAGLEGTVWVKILVDKDGLPKKAVVIKSTAEIFNEAAVAAGMGFTFTPAVMNNGPVKVWVAIPFKFVLKDAGAS